MRVRRRIAIVATLVITLLLLGAGLLWQRTVSFNDAVSTEPTHSSKLLGLFGGSERVNILLLGFADEGRPGAFLSDSISVLSIDPNAGTTTAISVPRDLWIEGSPHMPGNGKINQAFAIGQSAGGYEAAGGTSVTVVEWVTGLEVHGWLALDFRGFQEMVEAVGGVTVDNPRAFSWSWDEESFGSGHMEGTFDEGAIRLTGNDALAYVRVRYTTLPEESSDFARSARQHRVLAAVRDSLGSGGFGSVGLGLQLMDALEDRLHTDLSALDLYLLSSHLGPDRRVELAEGVVLEATRNSTGEYVLVVLGRNAPSDYGPLRSFIARELDG